MHVFILLKINFAANKYFYITLLTFTFIIDLLKIIIFHFPFDFLLNQKRKILCFFIK